MRINNQFWDKVCPFVTPDKAFRVRFKGSSTTNVQSYTPTAEEVRLQKQAADYSEAVSPNALWLNTTARNVLEDSLGTVQVDYDALNNAAQNQIANAQTGVNNLANGVLPTGYQENMENSIRSGVQNTMGSTLNSLAARGVLNSSVTNTALNDISKNASDTMAEQYSNNISTLNGLYGQQASLAGQGITTAAAAQEAAQQPALNLWNASLGLNGSTTSALSAVAGQGEKSTTTTTSGSGGLASGLFGLGSTAFSVFCFTEDTQVETFQGETKAISEIEPGDTVVGVDENGERLEAEVIATLPPRESDTWVVVAEDAEGKRHSVATTLSQPFLMKDGKYKTVSIMRIGDELAEVGKVVNFSKNGRCKVYDLKLAKGKGYIAEGFIAKAATNEW